MADQGSGMPSQGGGQNLGLDLINSTLQNSAKIMSLLVTTLQNMFPRVTGTFTLGAAATTVVSQSATQANSVIVFTATNAAAGTLQGSAKSLYVSARTAGASFTVATANAAAAAGTETFSYILVNPV